MAEHILYLASGSSRRFGGNKLLHPLEDKPMFLHGLETLRQAAQTRKNCTVTVVSRYPEIRESARAMGLAAVDSPQSEQGISYTIKAGLQALGPLAPGDFVLFAVADQPRLRASSVIRLLEAARPGVLCASLCWQDRPGNPTLFSAALVPELMALEGDTGGRAVLKRHPCLSIQAEDSRELEDIDLKMERESPQILMGQVR